MIWLEDQFEICKKMIDTVPITNILYDEKQDKFRSNDLILHKYLNKFDINYKIHREYFSIELTIWLVIEPYFNNEEIGFKIFTQDPIDEKFEFSSSKQYLACLKALRNKLICQKFNNSIVEKIMDSLEDIDNKLYNLTRFYDKGVLV